MTEAIQVNFEQIKKSEALIKLSCGGEKSNGCMQKVESKVIETCHFNEVDTLGPWIVKKSILISRQE